MTQPPEPPAGQQPPPGQPYDPPAPPAYPPPAQDYPAQPYPAQGYPAQPYPTQPYPAQPWQAGPPPVGTNGLSIAALVTGIIGFLLLSIPFGIVALRQIKKTGQNGRGMAIAGIVLGGLWTVAFIAIGIVVAVVVDNYVDRDDNGTIVGSGWMFLDDLQVGDCMENAAVGDSVWKVRGVPCSDPHIGEVYAFVDLEGDTYPSSDSMFRTCVGELQTGFPDAWEDEDLQASFVSPSDEGWDAGDRELVCYATTEEPRTGSITD